MDDGGVEDDGGVDGGDDAGQGPSFDAGQTVESDGGTGERPKVRTGCGCNSIDFAPLGLVALLLLRRKKGSLSPHGQRGGVRGQSLLLTLVILGFTSCTSALETPPIPDAAVEFDAGIEDAGVDAGFIPRPEWPCPGLFPVEHLMAFVPGTAVAFAHNRRYAVTTKDTAQMLVFDDAPANFAGFTLRRPVPADIDPMQPGALETFAAREIAALGRGARARLPAGCAPTRALTRALRVRPSRCAASAFWPQPAAG
jgi:hypothetical protein